MYIRRTALLDMNLIRDDERGFASAVSRLAHCNPFLPERVDLERQALGAQFVPLGGTWHARGESELRPNLSRLQERSEAFVPAVRERLVAGGRFAPQELSIYADGAVYLLFERYEHDFLQLIIGAHPARPRVAFYHRFRRDFDSLLALPGITLPDAQDPLHIFACLFQVRRAFHFIFQNILGGSMAAARLRAAVWQSIFTRDMRRYRRSLYQRMGDMATLISGPSGTGKELVARAIGLARYIPFDPEREAFAEDFAGAFYALNLSALSPTLIESELFGHRRGAFTGALQDRSGWLDVCPQFGAVFLDEIGELDVAIQVKLLRVLQSRTFQRLGDTRDRTFRGKIIAATNRDLKREILTGRFREDFYYRLCSDLIST
ncbi:MAG TPA: sigma-54 factor interaction domain-containing protein, partial [Methylomirabilota bacterium]|nr:sigma-54 factor interaction domain-containing protein [Methylomirabilota bacterium]